MVLRGNVSTIGNIILLCYLYKHFWKYFSMPIPRRHMVTVIVKTKLILVGGVGKYRMKLQSVDVFDVHKREYSNCDINKDIK